MKFLEEYADRQALIWKIFSKHQNIPDKISNLHLHIDDFKGNIQKEFNFLKEATRKNIENFQASLSLQQTYSVALGSHINNIYHKISELQQQLPHPTQHMNTGDIIQINAPEFDLDIEGGPSMKEHGEIQGSDNPIQHRVGETKKSEAPAAPQQVEEEVDWSDTVPVEVHSTHQKPKRWKRTIIMKALTISTIICQIRVEATDLIMVRAKTDHLEDLYHEIEDKDLNIVNLSFRITAIREAHCNKIVHNMVVHVNRIFKGTK